ncbi:MAG: BLUF domain-containing protein [Gammaproteobacteria bacterium]
MTLRRIVYSSNSSARMDERSLLDLLHDARDLNAADDISGVLLYRDGRFVQVLEGAPDVIEDVWRRIRGDKRHEQVAVCADEMVEERIFTGWSMGFADLADPALRQLPGVNDAFVNPAGLLEDARGLPDLRDRLARFLEPDQSLTR